MSDYPSVYYEAEIRGTVQVIEPDGEAYTVCDGKISGYCSPAELNQFVFKSESPDAEVRCMVIKDDDGREEYDEQGGFARYWPMFPHLDKPPSGA